MTGNYLNHKVFKPLVIIVGIGSGLGFELARKFGSNGYDIALLGRNAKVLSTVQQNLSTEGIHVYSIPTDVACEKSIESAFRELDKFSQPIHGLIYNAVARRTVSPSSLTAEDVTEDLKVNLFGAISCTGQVLKRFKRQGDEFILYTGGGVALSPSTQSASMSIGKAAIRNYALNLAEELKKSRIFTGTVTITKKMEYGTKYSPDLIASSYLKMIRSKDTFEIVI